MACHGRTRGSTGIPVFRAQVTAIAVLVTRADVNFMEVGWMSEHAWWLVLLATVTTVHGLIAGASLDQSVEQLPARHRVGMRAYRAYSQASHMANGRFWLIPMGIGGPVLTIAAAIWAATLDLPAGRLLPVGLAAALAVAYTVSTVVAARANWPIAPWARSPAPDDEAVLARIFRRFERRQAVRAILQFLRFAVTVWALAVNGPATS